MYGIIAITVLLLILSFRSLWTRNKQQRTFLAIENIILLMLIYATILTGFGLIYVLFELNGISVLSDSSGRSARSFLELLANSMYFSAVTLFSVGYGDITPVSVGRLVAVIEAMIGYIMPAAFVVRTVIDIDKQHDE